MQKDPMLAAILAFLFGPLGMLYVSVQGALIMFLVNVVVGVVTLGFGLVLCWPACAIWAYSDAKKHNAALGR